MPNDKRRCQNRMQKGEPMSLIDIYVRDKETNKIHRIGDDQHDMLTITEANELFYHNLQNGDGCRTGDDCGGYEFVPNEDEYGYNADPREEGDDE